MNIDQGNVYWCSIPKGDKENPIPHPQVVIQDTIINQSRIDSIVVCGITTNMKKVGWPGNILLHKNEANLIKESIVDVSQVSVIKKSELGDFIGQLTPDRLSQIFSGMLLVQSLKNHNN